MASAFIIQVQPQLQKDPNEETAALLRVLIHKIDNTTFGDDVPALPQWTGPGQMVIHVQFILYASLAASLLSAFLAMLGKQWLNRYASIDMRGSAIERSQNRQRKLDGIIAWYFEHVLECLPLMLQVALLLLGCALSRYLWEINTAVASMVIGVTLFGMLFYLFIIAAGATSDGCPYQTPWTNIIRRLLHSLVDLLIKHSKLYWTLFEIWNYNDKRGAAIIIVIYPLLLLDGFAADAFRLGRAMFRSLVVSAREVRSWLFRTSPVPEQALQALDHQATTFDFRCISWILQTSLDKTINLLTLDFLKTILATPGFNNDIILGCFNVFSNCFVVNDHGDHAEISITRGSEQLADTSAMCFFRAFSSLLITTPTSSAIGDMRQRYWRVFQYHNQIRHPQFPLYVNAVHRLFCANAVYRLFPVGPRIPRVLFRDRLDFAWTSYNPPLDELVPFAHALAQFAQFAYQNGDGRDHKVPRWLLRFVLRFLSQHPLPPTSVVINCLTIIATDLGCNLSDISSMPSDERCVHAPETTVPLLTPQQHTA